jgi:hypothetical protein
MFAVIMQSQSNFGVRQTAVIPMMNASIRVFTRIGAVRGIAGAWREEAPEFDSGELVLGQSIAITITANDYRDLQYPITPTTLLQKLVRTTSTVSTLTSASEEFERLLGMASSNPAMLVNYTKAGNNVSLASPPVVQPPVVQVVETPTPQVQLIESEPVMAEPIMAFHAVTPTHGNDTVLVIPDVKPYFARIFDGIGEEKVYDYARSTQQNVLLTGDAGTGKTSSARNYAAIKQLPFEVIECTQQIDQSKTQGQYIATGVGNAMRWQLSRLATIIQGPGVVLINELTRMTPKAASLFLRLLEEREMIIDTTNEVISVHPDCLFIADQNTGIGYTGTQRQDAALIDRFNLQLEFKYDTKIEANFIKSPALLDFATGIRHAAETNDQFSVPLSSRALMNFQEQALSLGFAFAANRLLNKFPKADGEREAVKMRFDADATTIATELGVEFADYSTK